MKKLIFWLFILLIIALGIYLLHPFILEGMARFLIVQDRLESADMIVVVAGDNNGERVNEAVRLYKKGYAKKIIMSGGPLAWNLTSAEWMKRQAMEMGIPSQAIIMEKESRSTLANAELVFPMLKKMGVKSLILVTSPTHSRRAKRVFEKHGKKAEIKVICYPAQVSEFRLPKWWTRHEDTQLVMWEYVSLVYYFFKGY